jgi:pyrroline-5-carboxylate reductase
MDKIESGGLWLLGCGNMGGALLSRWSAAGLGASTLVIDPAGPKVPDGVETVSALPTPGERKPPACLVVAVKPQIAAAALDGIADLLSPATVVVSIMAGLPLSRVAALTGASRLVRAMPNTPAAIGKGVTALCGRNLDDTDRASVERLFEAAGWTFWLSEEGQFDAVTAVSGSGPAYLFRFIEALASAGESAGLPGDLAVELARRTVVGAAALADADERTPRELRAAVTSPGGTTQAGLEALDADPGLPQLLRLAVRAAVNRSRELAG